MGSGVQPAYCENVNNGDDKFMNKGTLSLGVLWCLEHTRVSGTAF